MVVRLVQPCRYLFRYKEDYLAENEMQSFFVILIICGIVPSNGFVGEIACRKVIVHNVPSCHEGYDLAKEGVTGIQPPYKVVETQCGHNLDETF